MSYQAYLDTIKKNTGKSPEDFRALAAEKGLLQPGVKAAAVLAWLKADFGLGHGHAMAMYGTIRPSDGPQLTPGEQIGKHFAGRRAAWREPYAQLMAKVTAFGPGVTVAPTNSYLSVLRARRKFAIIQVTADRLDVGIKLKDQQPTSRLLPAGTWNAMVTHRVRVQDPGHIDGELLAWLRLAYENA
jgi:Domain of unknown function (DUF4287)/Domain of unknown function (DUF5655)